MTAVAVVSMSTLAMADFNTDLVPVQNAKITVDNEVQNTQLIVELGDPNNSILSDPYSNGLEIYGLNGHGPYGYQPKFVGYQEKTEQIPYLAFDSLDIKKNGGSK